MDERIKASFYRVAQLEALKFDSYPDVSFVPSEEFEAKIKILIEKTSRKENSIATLKLKKVIIVAIASLLILSCAITAIAFGEQIKQFFVEIFEDHINLKVEDDEVGGLKVYNNITFTPEGFQMVDCIKSNYNYVLVFENEMKLSIIYEQASLSASSINIDAENSELSKRFLGNVELYILTEKGYYSIVWRDENSSYFISCPTSISWADIEKMILSLEPEEI